MWGSGVSKKIIFMFLFIVLCNAVYFGFVMVKLSKISDHCDGLVFIYNGENG